MCAGVRARARWINGQALCVRENMCVFRRRSERKWMLNKGCGCVYGKGVYVCVQAIWYVCVKGKFLYVCAGDMVCVFDKVCV